ncbi:MAG: PQQ-binding-like beta-propeller repeat protein [Planctomycetota bacterium]
MPASLDKTADASTRPAEKPGRSGTRWRRFSIRLMLLGVALLAPILAFVGSRLNEEIPAPLGWDIQSGTNIKWIAELGSQTYSSPAISGDLIFVGTNNAGGYLPDLPSDIDQGVLLCLDRRTGEFVWQHSNAKLPEGRVNDWPLQGVTSSPFAESGCVWYVSNRGEVICLDQDGFLDGTNDGDYEEEASQREIDADVIWKFNLINELGVFPHNISHCNVEVDSEFVYVKTSNGVNESHRYLPAPDAPSFVVLDRTSGKLIWHDNSPGESIMHGSWGSPRLATIDGVRQILFPGGDGWLYSFAPAGDGNGSSVLLWKFDCNPKTSRYPLGRPSGRNNLLTEPTVVEDRIYVTMGQDPEHGYGPSRVWCISPGGRRGDLSPTLVTKGDKVESPGPDNEFRHCIEENGDLEIPNPASAAVWEYTGLDIDGDGELANDEQMSCSLSRVVHHEGCLFVTDIYGHLHCLDAQSGKRNWIFDCMSTLWSSPMVNGEHVFIFDEDGMVNIFKAHPDPTIAMPGGSPVAMNDMVQSVYSNAVVSDGVLYITTRNQMLAIEDENAPNAFQKLFRR